MHNGSAKYRIFRQKWQRMAHTFAHTPRRTMTRQRTQTVRLKKSTNKAVAHSTPHSNPGEIPADRTGHDSNAGNQGWGAHHAIDPQAGNGGSGFPRCRAAIFFRAPARCHAGRATVPNRVWRSVRFAACAGRYQRAVRCPVRLRMRARLVRGCAGCAVDHRHWPAAGVLLLAPLLARAAEADQPAQGAHSPLVAVGKLDNTAEDGMFADGHRVAMAALPGTGVLE